MYRTKDGWIFIMCNKEKFWGVLCDTIGRPEWSDAPRFRTFKDRLAHRALTPEYLDSPLSKKTTADCLATFPGKVRAAPTLDVEQALASGRRWCRERVGQYGVCSGAREPVK